MLAFGKITGIAAAFGLATMFTFAGAVAVPDTADAVKVTRKMRIYCKSDYQRFCPRYKVTSSRARQCMRANARNLSPICKKVLIEAGYTG